MRISKKRNPGYFKIFEKIHADPFISALDISLSVGLSRNTVTKYLKDMYEMGILVGPHIQMKPAPNYREYVYLLNFSDPLSVFNGLRTFPHVIHHALTFGDWNTVVITDRLLDFSKLVGFETMVYQGMRGFAFTPKVEYISWNESFQEIYERMEHFSLGEPEKDRKLAPHLEWGEDEWKLFSTFKYDLRKRVTPTLRKIKVGYETFTRWRDTLGGHCTILTGFYPERYQSELIYWLLFDSDYESVVKSLFSILPASPFLVEVGTQLLVTIATPLDVARKLICTIYDMKTKKIIKRVSQAAGIFYSQH